MDESVIEAMRAAVTADPGNAALRAHLSGLLVEANKLDEAWAHATAGLAIEPANVPLLHLAIRSGEASDRHSEVAGYRTLVEALGGADSKPEPEASPASPPWHTSKPAANEPTSADSDDLDALLDTPVPSGEVPRLTAGGDVPDSVDDLLEMWDDTAAMPEPSIGEISRDRLLLADVGGMEEVKQRLHTSFLNPMRNPEMQAAFGKSMRGGLLLWGPPGCGKTFVAKAVAGELDANFYSIGLSDVLDMFIGSSEKNISSIFETARRNAPCVLFFDEVDAIGQKRTQLRGGGGSMRGVVNQLLQEMDGADSENEGVFVLAATNHPWDVDSALLRPGRFDRSLLVLPPDAPAREAILELHFRSRPTSGLNLAKCAKATEGLSGADLALVAEQATETAMEESIASGEVQPITMRHVALAIKGVSPSYEPWVEAARNFATFNNESGKYDELITWLKRRKR